MNSKRMINKYKNKQVKKELYDKHTTRNLVLSFHDEMLRELLLSEILSWSFVEE